MAQGGMFGGGNVSPRMLMAQQLLAQGGSGAPVQHWTQGLNRLAQALVGARMAGMDSRDEQAAMAALGQGVSAPQWINPDTGTPEARASNVAGAPMVPTPQAGGYEGAITALGGLRGNRMAQDLMSRLAMGKFESDIASKQKLQELMAQYGLEVAKSDRDRAANFENQKALKGMDAESRREAALIAAGARSDAAERAAQKPLSDEGQLASDYRSGHITEEQFNAGMSRLAKPVQAKPLPTAAVKSLTEAGEMLSNSSRFVETFQPEFGGKTITGGLGNTIGRITGDETGQSQWWQDYELHQSMVRNKLFGSALTKVEVDSWNKAAVNPRMDPVQIEENLARRAMLERKAGARLAKTYYTAGTYPPEQIEAATGLSYDDVFAEPDAQQPIATPSAGGIKFLGFE